MSVFKEVQNLYLNSKREMAKWMWKNHVQFVAERAQKLAIKYKADKNLCVYGALLHDLGDVWMEREDDQFELKSKEEATKILQNTGLPHHKIEVIITEVIKPHSCYPNNTPTLLEGKILATADALAHLATPFYLSLYNMGLPKHIPRKEFSAWVIQKIKRDFFSKIFFEDERTKVERNYKILIGKFSK